MTADRRGDRAERLGGRRARPGPDRLQAPRPLWRTAVFHRAAVPRCGPVGRAAYVPGGVLAGSARADATSRAVRGADVEYINIYTQYINVYKP